MDASTDSQHTRDAGPARLAIVVPCYNEQEMLPLSGPRLESLLADMVTEGLVAADSYVLFVNDGSADRTWSLIRAMNSRNPAMQGLDLMANVGHQNAILAGMIEAAGDSVCPAEAIVTIDADLQDPPELIADMMREFYKGAEVVYGVRSSRKSDSFFKRFTAESFYKFQASLGLKTIYNHADFRLMSRRAVLELAKYDERNLYLRGIIPMMGLPSATVDEVRAERQAGETKYTLRKMMRLALDGVTSFSITPIYVILTTGLVFVAIALGIGVYVLVSLFSDSATPGWASLMLSLWLIGGMLMISVGMVGVYVGKAYMESKHRPRYHIYSRLR